MAVRELNRLRQWRGGRTRGQEGKGRESSQGKDLDHTATRKKKYAKKAGEAMGW